MSAATPVTMATPTERSVQSGSSRQSSVQRESEPNANQLSPTQNASSAQPEANAIEQQIAQLAYVLWQQRGCIEGSPEQDWFEAERRVLGALKR